MMTVAIASSADWSLDSSRCSELMKSRLRETSSAHKVPTVNRWNYWMSHEGTGRKYNNESVVGCTSSLSDCVLCKYRDKYRSKVVWCTCKLVWVVKRNEKNEEFELWLVIFALYNMKYLLYEDNYVLPIYTLILLESYFIKLLLRDWYLTVSWYK